MAAAHELGIDFGTSNTVAVLRWADGRVRPLLFDGVPLLPSAVFLDASGQLLVGREAAHAARTRPEAYEPNPKRRIDDGTVLLGDTELTVEQLFAGVLGRVRAEASRVAPDVNQWTLTCPAAWGPRRRAVLVAAAAEAGINAPRLADEPVAAASYFAQVHGSRLSVGALAVVYDFGAGTFDASVVRRTAEGFDVLASEGLPDAGGLDVDASIVAYFGALYAARDPASWHRLEQPQTSADRRAHRMLWDDVRGAKESLSRTSATLVPIPLLNDDAPLGREQLERLSRPILDRTVGATFAALRSANVDRGAITEVYLVGGSSRMPLVATMLHHALGIAPTAIEQPEMVVAEGSLFTRAAATHATALPSAPTSGSPLTPPVWPARGVAPVPSPISPGPTSPTSPAGPDLTPLPDAITVQDAAGLPAPPRDDIWPPPEPAEAPPPADDGWPHGWPQGAEPVSTPPATPTHTGQPIAQPAYPTHAAYQPPPQPAQPTAQPAAQPAQPAAQPAQPATQPAQPNYRIMLFTGLGIAAVIALIAIATSINARNALIYGMRGPLVLPALALLPAAVVLLATGSESPLRRAARLVAGFVVGFTVTLPFGWESSGDSVEQGVSVVRMIIGMAAGVAFVVVGVRLAMRAGRPRGTAGTGRLGRFAVPLAGAGFAGACLAYTDVGLRLAEATLNTFRYTNLLDGLGLYIAFLIGFVISVATATLAVTLVRGHESRAAGGGSGNGGSGNGGAVAGGVLLAFGGVFVTYASIYGVLFVTDAPVLDEFDLGQFRGTQTYNQFDAFASSQAFPWLVGAAFVGLLVAVLVRTRTSRR